MAIEVGFELPRVVGGLRSGVAQQCCAGGCWSWGVTAWQGHGQGWRGCLDSAFAGGGWL